MGFEKRQPGTAADWKTNVQDKLQKFSDVCQARTEVDREHAEVNNAPAMLAHNPMLYAALFYRSSERFNNNYPFAVNFFP